MVAVDDGSFDQRPAFDQLGEQGGDRILVADRFRAQRLQSRSDGTDVPVDFIFARTPYRLADCPCRLEGFLRRPNHEVRQVDHQQREDHRDDQGRHDGEQAVGQHQPHMEAGARRAASTVEPELGEPNRQDRHQGDGDHQIGDEERRHPALRRERSRREAGQPRRSRLAGRLAERRDLVGHRNGQDSQQSKRHRRDTATEAASDGVEQIAPA